MVKRSYRFAMCKAVWVTVLLSAAGSAAAENRSADLTLLSLEQLMNVEVTMVSKREQTLFLSPWAVFVLTHNDLKRSGATSIPEALRLVPGMEVGRIDASKWAVSARSFNAQFANKLLVLIDGRSVYTPFFSGVLWDTQDIPLDEVDRIEVVRGPGAALWGANAVTGIINIKTRHAAKTRGHAVTMGGGTEELGFGSVRHGGRWGGSIAYRGYAKYNRRGDSVNAVGRNLNDGWDHWRAGFRVDGNLAKRRSRWMLKGEYYRGDIGQTIVEVPIGLNAPYTATYNNQISISGMHLQGRWVRRAERGGKLAVQTYFHCTRRGDRFNGAESRNTYDLELQQNRVSRGRHSLVWGMGQRITWDDFDNTFAIVLKPETRTLHTTNVFIHDEIAITHRRLRLSLGTKLERHSISGFELLPNVRLLWAPRDTHVWWASGQPSRTHSVTLRKRRSAGIGGAAARDPGSWNPGGYTHCFRRSGPQQRDHVGAGIGVPGARGSTGYRRRGNLLQLVHPSAVDGARTVDRRPGRLGALLFRAAGGDWTQPQGTQLGRGTGGQLGLGSTHDLRWNLRLNCDLRYVAKLTRLPVDGYLTADARVGWRPYADVEFALIGRNLVDDRHLEFPADFSGGRSLTKVERSVYGMLTWSVEP